MKLVTVLSLSLILPGTPSAVFAYSKNVNFDSWYQKHASSIPKRIQTNGNSVFIFNPHSQRWTVYNADGQLVGAGHGSGGRNFCPDIQEPCRTPVGTFEVDGFGGPDCESNLFPVGKGGAPMPYCMYVNGDFAIHGSDHVPNYNASHGCIRVKPSVAKWLQDNVIDYGTTVIVNPY